MIEYKTSLVNTLLTLLTIAGCFLFILFVISMFYAILSTPEPGWEFELAWEHFTNTLQFYKTGFEELFSTEDK